MRKSYLDAVGEVKVEARVSRFKCRWQERRCTRTTGLHVLADERLSRVFQLVWSLIKWVFMYKRASTGMQSH